MIKSMKAFAAILNHRLDTIAYLVDILDDPIKSKQFQFEYNQKKKNGKTRPIVPSLTLLKEVQKSINERIFSKVTFPHYLTGSIKKRSGVINGKIHAGNKYYLQTDLSSFYSFVTSKMVYDALKQLGFSKDVNRAITRLCTYKGHLGQGPNTSPFLANLVGLVLDKPLLNFCANNNLIYSRYVDDITISSKEDFKVIVPELLNEILMAKFQYNHSKTFYKVNTIETTGVKIGYNGIEKTEKQKQKFQDLTLDIFSHNGLAGYIKYIKKVNRTFLLSDYVESFKELKFQEKIYPRNTKLIAK